MQPSPTVSGIVPRSWAAVLVVLSVAVRLASPVFAQAPLPNPAQPPSAYPPAELERIVFPIALYPDPLLAQVLVSATFSADRLTWDPSVQALLPFPSVLETMASDIPWTEELGNDGSRHGVGDPPGLDGQRTR